MKKILFALAMTFGFAGAGSATDFECITGDEVRHITLDYPGIDHLCEVSVTRQGGKRDVKWYADNDSQFCADKLSLLIEKYQNEWSYECHLWPDRSGLDNLTKRQRTLLDTLVKRVIEEGQSGEVPFEVTGARISETQLESTNSTALIAQLFLNTSTQPKESRTFYIEDSGAVFSTKTLEQVENSVTLSEPNHRIDDVIVSAIYPSGEIEISTTVFSSKDAKTPRCYGSQRFVKGTNGALDAVTDHKLSCRG